MKPTKFFYKVTEKGEPIPATLGAFPSKPKGGKWIEIKEICCETPLSEEIATALAQNEAPCSFITYGISGDSLCPEAKFTIKVNGVLKVNATVITGSPASGILNVNDGDAIEMEITCGTCGFNDEAVGNSSDGNFMESFSLPAWDEDYFDYNNTHKVNFTVSGCNVGYVTYGNVRCTEPTYTLSGKITNASSSPVEGATITVTGSVTGTSTNTTTDASGNYSIAGLPPQEYTFDVDGLGGESYTSPITITNDDVTKNVVVPLPTESPYVMLRSSDLDQVADLSTALFNIDSYAIKTSAIVNAEVGTNGWYDIIHWNGVKDVPGVIAALNAAIAVNPATGSGTHGVASQGDTWNAALSNYFPLTLVGNKIKTSAAPGSPALKLYAPTNIYDFYPETV